VLDLLPATKGRYRVAETIHGTFHYHLRAPDLIYALCGARVMQTSIPVSAWGARTHINERWCQKCADMARALEAKVAADGDT
jgi:hypothetical protein